MRKKRAVLIALISVAFLGIVNAQEKLNAPTDAFGKTTIQYLKANGIHNQYERATTQLFVMLKKQFAAKNVPTTVWVELEQAKPIALQNVKIRMVQAYKAYFNTEEMNEILSFYTSSEGKIMVYDSASLTDDDRKVIKDFFHSTVGQKMMLTQKDLAKLIGEISETWSSQLYQTQIEKLAAKGFSL